MVLDVSECRKILKIPGMTDDDIENLSERLESIIDNIMDDYIANQQGSVGGNIDH
jgi:hypothetical protein